MPTDPSERRLEPLWSELRLRPQRDLGGGHQSRVVLATGPDGPVVVKLDPEERVDTAFRSRIELSRRAAALDDAVTGPIEMPAGWVTTAAGFAAVCYPYVEGTSPDTSHRADVERMGTTLASLHRTLASIELPALPPTTALAGAGPPGDHDQPLHGDFGAPNLLTTTDGLRIIDFGDAGTGSIAFELGNSLYLDLFDSWVAGDPERHGRFRTWFLDAYAERAGRGIDTDLVNEATRIRMETLRRWLDQPDQAPPGIRGATPAWHGRLRSFLSDAPAMIDP